MILGAWPVYHDPAIGHLFSIPADADPLSRQQIAALRAFRTMQSEYLDACRRSSFDLQPNSERVQLVAPRRALARIAMKLLRIGLNARDLLRQLDAVNARLASPLPSAAIRDVAIWAANARRGVRHGGR
jgi:hypothetical protein